MDHVSDHSPQSSRKRKLDPEIEVDLSAPEPPSKKALRKAKKAQATAKHEEPASIPEQISVEPRPETTAKRSGYGIWIGNLPFFATTDDLRTFLSTQGSFKSDEITRVHLPNGNKKNGKQLNKGFAYIDFSTSDAVQRALALSEKLLLGRAVLIKNAKDFTGRPEKTQENEDSSKKSNGPARPPSKKIFVGNLAFDVTKEALEEHYQPCGSITHIHLATFEDSGKCKGYGWVEFEELESAEAAVRGWLLASQNEDVDSAEHSGSDEQPSKARKTKQKKVWVNRLLGRSLRVEFAEDSTTRYKKRFGKEGSERQGSSRDHDNSDGGQKAPIEEVPNEKSIRSRNKGSGKAGGYSRETVQRLSGAIVASQGKKSTFD